MHCAALIVVPESVKQPLRYYRENVSKTVSLLEHMTRNDCRQLLFSSSASIYRPGDDFSVDERSPIEPDQPLRAQQGDDRRHHRRPAPPPVSWKRCRCATSTRSAPIRRCAPGCRPLNPTHALGKMIEAWENGTVFPVTGADWPTRDGTGIRDYIHVWDLARAHVNAHHPPTERAVGQPDPRLPGHQPRHRDRHHGS